MDQIDWALQQKWYYTVELAKNRFTNGSRFRNIAVTRRLLEAISVKGASVLDISAMEGLFSVLLSRRGGDVLATDSIDNRERLEILRRVYEAVFEYMPHAPVVNHTDCILNQQSSRGPINPGDRFSVAP